MTRHPVPVILDTDIGTDIDDTWALGYMLKCPELDVRLVTTVHGDTRYRAKIAGKVLEIAGRGDIPVGIGEPGDDRWGPQAAWVYDYDLDAYPGGVMTDGVQAIIDTIMAAGEPVTVIGIGPLTSVAAALRREPRIAGRARFVGMTGSVRTGYGGQPGAVPEYNVVVDPGACDQVLAAPWGVTITPLDTCGTVILDGDRYRKVRESSDPVAMAVMENYDTWSIGRRNVNVEQASSVLFDTVAIHLAHDTRFLHLERLGLRATVDGYTIHDGSRKPVACATKWTDREAFTDMLANRLAGSPC